MATASDYRVQEFNGVRFYRKPNGYYYANHRQRDLESRSMHRVVWMESNGPIPHGFHVHHINEDRGDNRLENLVCLSAKDHAAEHDSGGDEVHMSMMRERSRAWHQSEAGRQWHSEHGRRIYAEAPTEAHRCIHCGDEYQIKRSSRKKGYCSPACQTAARKASGVDDIDRVCANCGLMFKTNRYGKRTNCSQECGRQSSVANRRG